jgi:hypothetical protein
MYLFNKVSYSHKSKNKYSGQAGRVPRLRSKSAGILVALWCPAAVFSTSRFPDHGWAAFLFMPFVVW